jgi:hypothetical protein
VGVTTSVEGCLGCGNSWSAAWCCNGSLFSAWTDWTLDSTSSSKKCFGLSPSLTGVSNLIFSHCHSKYAWVFPWQKLKELNEQIGHPFEPPDPIQGIFGPFNFMISSATTSPLFCMGWLRVWHILIFSHYKVYKLQQKDYAV